MCGDEPSVENRMFSALWRSLHVWGCYLYTGNNVLKELGGWSSLEMVLRYAHLSTEQLAEHAERLAKPKVIRTNSGTPKENAQPIRVGR